mmetsp:Transcript_2312/g.6748  ORF Transcript_2312/g.6748 Transcript_2312/m.6748 type:complete len:220 (-) Transcript_2312:216-875(-)
MPTTCRSSALPPRWRRTRRLSCASATRTRRSTKSSGASAHSTSGCSGTSRSRSPRPMRLRARPYPAASRAWARADSPSPGWPAGSPGPPASAHQCPCGRAARRQRSGRPRRRSARGAAPGAAPWRDAAPMVLEEARARRPGLSWPARLLARRSRLAARGRQGGKGDDEDRGRNAAGSLQPAGVQPAGPCRHRHSRTGDTQVVDNDLRLTSSRGRGGLPA